jgi:YbgC/YbaW family acyl-CoA thioester hydrolase
MIDQSVEARPAGPTLAEALAWPRTLTAVVEPRFIDRNGHMNVAWYVHLFDEATVELFRRHGLDEEHRRQANAAMFAVEENIRYLGELREGDSLEVHTRLLDVRPKALRFVHVMTDPRRGRIAATAELVGVYIDQASRRSIAFPTELLPGLQAELAAWGGPTLDDAAAQRFARGWIEAWNRRDAEAVLAHYADDAVFVSPKAEVVVGQGRLTSKADLRRYWEAALAGIRTLRFTLDAAAWSAGVQTLTILYTSFVDDQPPRRATEIMRFRGDRVVAGEALYGAVAAW